MTLSLPPQWRLAALFAAVTALSSVALVGVSAWFLAAVALAGLGPAAFAYNFHFPAALVRLLALLRTGGKYGERLTGHVAALSDQNAHRQRLFAQMAEAKAPRQEGWQLARTDRLETFLTDVESVDFVRLRSLLPALAGVIGALFVIGLTLLTVPLALPALAVVSGGLCLASLVLSAKAATLMDRGAQRRRAFGHDVGQKLASAVPLEGGRERRARLGESLAIARQAERDLTAARMLNGLAERILSVFGPLACLTILSLAALTGELGEQAVPAVLAAFAALSFGEVMFPLARADAARREARQARGRLSYWTTEAMPAVQKGTPPTQLEVTNLPLIDPAGRALGGTVSFRATPGHPVALVGPSGCGKTTLLKRLAGWLPSSDDLGLPQALGPHCHLSLHDAAVLTGTLRDALLSDQPDEALWSAVKAVELDQRFEDRGLETHLGQETISLGEARRIALARAYLSPKPVLLLDEPGEHLDQAQARRILGRLLDHQADKVIVMVTHAEELVRGKANPVAC
ncbi:putative transport ATP-binding protein CydC [Parvularcula bermudensis HTCC2503]|uniref:Putative transport ATP-binding protein CydC n=1 Tax=Parvularcula bermudensis (strain ATCC BAA-594 / HTCC2503 / KCTC 12087) TaxID=314260 RepID=E0THD8_PARBH|nr:ATP-binding cassette domain-containing protein [Parvularcula bermudensis]ADM10730.1 putative transport ATP-binding protein CydC [Parvularcula bermudensis HTCC2503]